IGDERAKCVLVVDRAERYEVALDAKLLGGETETLVECGTHEPRALEGGAADEQRGTVAGDD
ncbi:hypothetical protein NL463_29940, partial [Klebsiella pneumoniae]|nr:hypothetical protein [Klebsiella pneumoniae]